MTPYQVSSEIYGGFFYPGITLSNRLSKANKETVKKNVQEIISSRNHAAILVETVTSYWILSERIQLRLSLYYSS